MSEVTIQARAPLGVSTVAVSTTVTNPIRWHKLGAVGRQSLVLMPTVNTYIRFGNESVGAATNAYELFVANEPQQIKLDSASTYFTALGTGSGTLYWYVENSPQQTAFQDLFGSLLVDEWSRESNASATAWVSLNGRSLAKSGTPTFAADGTNFDRGHKVVGTLKAGPDYFAGTGLTSLAASSSRPYLAFVGRFVTLNADPFIVAVGGTTNYEQYCVYVDAGSFIGFTNTGSTVLTHTTPADTAVHFFEIWLDGTNLNLSIDGVTVSVSSAASMEVAITRVSIGADTVGSGANPADAFVSRVLFCSSVPNASQRASAYQLVKVLDQF